MNEIVCFKLTHLKVYKMRLYKQTKQLKIYVLSLKWILVKKLQRVMVTKRSF